MLLSIIFSLYLLLTATSGSTVGDVSVATEGQLAQVERKDRLHGIETARHRAEATLNNARDIFRVNASRPQRLPPVYGSKDSRAVGRHPVISKFNPQNFRPACPGCHFLSASPGSASCEYYVFALRRILC